MEPGKGAIDDLDAALRWLRGWLGAREGTDPAITVVADAQHALDQIKEEADRG